MLSHLLKNKLNSYEALVLNISHRSKCTTHTNLSIGLDKAIDISTTKELADFKDGNILIEIERLGNSDDVQLGYVDVKKIFQLYLQSNSKTQNPQ